VTPVFINNKEHSTCYILQRTTMHTVHDTMFELRTISFAIFKQIILLFSNVLNLLRLVKSAQTGNSFHKLTTLLLKKTFSNSRSYLCVATFQLLLQQERRRHALVITRRPKSRVTGDGSRSCGPVY